MQLLSPIMRMLQDKYHYNFKDEIGRNGSNGTVYDIGGNKVLKVTSNIGEAIAASIIKKENNLKNVVKIFRVFTTKNKNFDKYYIEEERLFPLMINDEYDEIYEYLIHKQNYESNFSEILNDMVIKSDSPKTFKKELLKFNKNEIDFICFLFQDKNWGDVGFEFEKFKQKYQRFKKQFNDLVNGINELKSIGIIFYDIHSKNIMKNSNGVYKFVDVTWHQQKNKFEIIDETKKSWFPIHEAKIKYATTPSQKEKGLRGIALEDWSGIMVFKNVKEGDVFVGDDCLFDIRIAFLDMSDRVLSVGTIKQGDGRVIAPKGTVKAIETASDDDYEIIKGSIYKIPANKPNLNPLSR